jgi:hypothetical protein
VYFLLLDARRYRQLQVTHQDQDDTALRKHATNLERDICRKAATKSEYMLLFNQEIHRLMQAEMATVNASFSNVPFADTTTTTTTKTIQDSDG